MTSAPLPFDPIAEAARNWADKGWDAEAQGMAFVTSVVRVHQILMARIDSSLEPFGLTFSRFEVLMLLLFTRKGQLPLGKIGGRLQVHAASVTNAIDRLEEAMDEMLARLLAVANHFQACVFLQLDPQERGIHLGLEQLIALRLPLRPELVGFGQPGGFGQTARD